MCLSKAKAKEYFTNSAHEIILTMQKTLEHESIFIYMPTSHLNRVINETKQELLVNYNKICDAINNNNVPLLNLNPTLNPSSV